MFKLDFLLNHYFKSIRLICVCFFLFGSVVFFLKHKISNNKGLRSKSKVNDNNKSYSDEKLMTMKYQCIVEKNKINQHSPFWNYVWCFSFTLSLVISLPFPNKKKSTPKMRKMRTTNMFNDLLLLLLLFPSDFTIYISTRVKWQKSDYVCNNKCVFRCLEINWFLNGQM